MKELLEHTACLNLEEIQNYAKGRLDEVARFRVENHVLDCALCRAALESYAANPDETASADLALLQQQIQNAPQSKVITMKNRVNYIAAASVLLVMGVAAIAYWQHTRYDRLYAAYFTAPGADEFIVMRGESNAPNADPEYVSALGFYESGDYTAAIPHFDRYLEHHPDDFLMGLYAGIASLHGGYPEKAIGRLTATGINDPKLFDEANWYLALAFLKQQNPTEAKAILKNLSIQADSAYAEKAKAVLKKLE